MKRFTLALSFVAFIAGFAFLAVEYRGRRWDVAAFGGLVGALLWIVVTGQLGDWRDILYPREPGDEQKKN